MERVSKIKEKSLDDFKTNENLYSEKKNVTLNRVKKPHTLKS